MARDWEQRISELESQLVALREQNAALREQNAALREQNAALLENDHRLREDNQVLKDEVARLKNQKGRPKIGPSKLLDEGKRKKRKKRKRGQKQKTKVDRVEVIQPEHVPEGSKFKGYKNYTVQELAIEVRTTQYRCGTWLTPDGKLLRGKLPDEATAGHFGPELQSFILYQYYHAQVTEPLIVEQLREWGVVISTGQVHRLITEGKEKFHAEKDEILRVGLRVSGHIHVDDTGARHQGKNGYATHIGNEWFAWFQTTASKSRINFLKLLNAGHTDYVLSGVALEYMGAQKLPKGFLSRLSSQGHRVYADERAWLQALSEVGIRKARHIRVASEGALLGAALEHGLNPHLGIVSDDAGQFNILCHALCWIHAERLLAKLVGFNDSQRKALEEVRTSVWALYRELKSYRSNPTPEMRRTLEARFDGLCDTMTCFASLNLALERMRKNKVELLMVLERPDLPLHNNLSEGDIREYVKRRKISGGTRSEAGRLGRDTFASLKKTCRKLGVSFWDYLNDRIRNRGAIQALPQLIEARAQSP